MWLPRSIFDLFSISKDYVLDLKVENASLKNEVNLLKNDLAASRANGDWFRIRVNALEFERAALLEKCYGFRTAVPEIARTTPVPHSRDLDPNFPLSSLDLFNDMGDEAARRLGLPTYDDKS